MNSKPKSAKKHFLSDERIAAIVRAKSDEDIADILRHAVLAKMAGLLDMFDPSSVDVQLDEPSLHSGVVGIH